MLTAIIINSFAIIGLHYATYYELNKDGKPCNKMALWFLRYYSEKYLPEQLQKPIIGCPQCMGSIWGIVGFVWGFGCTLPGLYTLPVYILAVSCVNLLISSTIEWLR